MVDRLSLTSEAIHQLTISSEPWMSCDECFDEIDVYIDAVLAGANGISPRLRTHLTGCGACFEEAWSLLLLAAGEQGANPQRALTRMQNDLGHAGLHWPSPPASKPRRRLR